MAHRLPRLLIPSLFGGAAGVGLATASESGTVPAPGAPAGPTRSVLVLIGDDHGLEIGAYGDPVVHTPHLDRLAARAQMEHNEPFVPTDAHEQKPTEQSALTFETERLICEVKMDGETPKQFFNIKGGMYKKFGITVWPEVLSAAGIPVAKLKGQDYKLPGYVATFVLNDKGKPSKVVKLEKVA